ncbi:hypothetical protein PUNSTDRAFT_85555 [Punctularia strigosozonata HHB-11173 SS5]|uniref:uncharacterized protein n=1 Tax=Punctularia strigosozonata (strain HHB-11173) TaxID=741275 RepID=UPI000441716F|nr:uncharacterized protein PUNSTDRAFT_85555 [Punctularia strigosozonata HHB-11173 SS5]EIN11038.1 hypothetical protein PUNSTDRAFT_85555 [Punctularia strigosozonata HHB-11173 SS5]
MEATSSTSKPVVDRGKTAPFLIRTFIKIGGFHRLQLFEDGALPTTDEQQIFTWKDATLREVLTTLRNTAPTQIEYRHPLGRYSFRAVYADPSARGRFASKELGTVYSRDILGEPGSLNTTAPRLLEDYEPGTAPGVEEGTEMEDATTKATRELTEREKDERLDELRFVPGDYLCLSVILPKNLTVPTPTGELAIKGAAPAGANGKDWKASAPGGRGDGGWGGSLGTAGGPPGGLGRGGGHWRGGSDAPAPRGGGRGGRAGGDRERLRDERVPPPRRRESPPPPRRGGGGWGDRGGRGGRDRPRSRSPRSRSPLPRRRYD